MRHASNVNRRDLAETIRRYRSKNAPFRIYDPAHQEVIQSIKRLGVPIMFATSQLCGVVFRESGVVENLGILSRKFITTVGVQFMVDCHLNTAELETINFHAMGTSGTAENIADVALTEVESRVAGTQSEPTATQYRTVATITATAARSVQEHGLFTASSAGTLFDRSVFTVINLAINDSIQFTYTLSYTAGG